MGMPLPLSADLTRALCRRAQLEGRSPQEIVIAAIDEYLARVGADEDEEVHRPAVEATHRWRSLLDRLAQ